MIRKFTPSIAAFFVLSLFFVSFILSCKSSREAMEESHKKIIARVDGEPVFEDDVIRRVKVSHRGVNKSQVSPERWQMMFEEATEAEIIDKLLLKEALSEGIEADKKEVDSFFDDTEEMLGEEGFQQMLTKRGSTKQEYREYLKERNLINKYKEKLFEDITIDDEILEKYFERHRESFKKLQTFEEAKEDLRESFLTGRRQKVIDDWYEAAKKNVSIEYIEK